MASPEPPSIELDELAKTQIKDVGELDEELAMNFAKRYTGSKYTDSNVFRKLSFNLKYYMWDLMSLRSSYDKPNTRNSKRTSILCNISSKNPLRAFACRFADSILFRHLYIFITLVLIAFLLGSGEKGVGRSQDTGYYEADIFFTSMYTFEILVFIFADGLYFAPYAYFTEPMHWLDFFLTFMGWMKFYFNENFTAIFRVLRLFTTLANFPVMGSVSVLLKCLIQSLTQILEITLVLIFFILIFAVIGNQLYSSILNYRCRNLLTGMWDATLFTYKNSQLCTPDEYGRFCDVSNQWYCRDFKQSPWHGMLNFDNIMTSFLSVFVIISNDGFTTFMFYLDDIGVRFNRSFCFFLTVMGNLYLTNLIIASIAMKFNKIRQKEQDRIEEVKSQHDDEMKERQIKLMRMNQTQQKEDNEGSEKEDDQNIPEHLKTIKGIKNDIRLTAPVVRARRIVVDIRFQTFIIGLILLNTGIMATNSYEISSFRQNFIFIALFFVTCIFAFEVYLKWRAYGTRNWLLMTPLNALDFIITICMILELAIKFNNADSISPLGAMSVLRLVHIIKFMHTWKPVQLVFTALLDTSTDIIPLFFFILSYLLIFGTIGMQQLGGHFSDANKEYLEPINAPEKRWPTFDNFLWSCLSVFQVMTGENWFRMMYLAIHYTGWGHGLLFIAMYIVGVVMLVAMTIAVLVGNQFRVNNEIEKKARLGVEEELEGFPLMLETLYTWMINLWCCRKRMMRAQEVQAPKGVEVYTPGVIKEVNSNDKNFFSNFVFQFVEVHQNGHISDEVALEQARAVEEQIRLDRMMAAYDKVDLHGTSCFFLWPSHRIRQRQVRILYSSWYNVVFLFLSLLGIIFLAVREPSAEPGSTTKLAMDTGDAIMTGIFLLEFLAQWTALGLFGHTGSYFGDKWNWVNFAITVTHVTHFIINILTDDDEIWRIFQSMLAFRAIRLLMCFPPTKRVLNAIFSTLPSFFKTIFLGFLLYVAFGIFALSLFKGRLRRCVRFDGKTEFFLNRAECETLNIGKWQNPAQASFDDIGGVLRTLYSIGTYDSWTDVQFLTMDATPINQPPMIDYSPEVSVYFFLFLLLAGFLVVSLFIALVVFTFLQVFSNRKIDMIKEVNTLWMKTYEEILMLTPKRRELDHKDISSNNIRIKAYILATTKWYEYFIFLMIIGQTIVIATHHPTNDTDFIDSMDGFYALAVWATVTELAFRVWAMNPIRCMADPYSRMDAICIFVTLVGWCLEKSSYTYPFRPHVFRVFAVFRLSRIASIYKPLEPIVKTIVISTFSLVNITIVVFITFLMYAYIGMILYGRLKHQNYINESANFENFGSALQLVFILAYGIDWTFYMHDCQIAPPLCTFTNDHLNECGWPTQSVLYFLSLSMITTFLLLNLFVAVLINSSKATADIIPAPVTSFELHSLNNAWSLAPKQSYLAMSVPEFLTFIDNLPAPFGLDLLKLNTNISPEFKDIYKQIDDIPLPVRVYYKKELEQIIMIEGNVRLDKMPRRKIVVVDDADADSHQDTDSGDQAAMGPNDDDDNPLGLYVHFVDVLLGIAALRFRQSFGAHFNPSTIARGEKAWRSLQQKYTYRYQQLDENIAMPLVGLFAIRVIWGHWRLMKYNYTQGKKQRDLAVQRSNAIDLGDTQSSASNNASSSAAMLTILENAALEEQNLLLDVNDPDASTDEEVRKEREASRKRQEFIEKPIAPNVDTEEFLRELVLSGFKDDPMLTARVRLAALEHQQKRAKGQYMARYKEFNSFAPPVQEKAVYDVPLDDSDSEDVVTSRIQTKGSKQKEKAAKALAQAQAQAQALPPIVDPMQNIYTTLQQAFKATVDTVQKIEPAKEVKPITMDTEIVVADKPETRRKKPTKKKKVKTEEGSDDDTELKPLSSKLRRKRKAQNTQQDDQDRDFDIYSVPNTSTE